jgi:hypothetical protein
MEDASISLLDIIVKHEEEAKIAAKQTVETAPVVAE